MFWLLGQRGVDVHNHCNGEQFVMFHECTASLRATLHWCIQSRFLHFTADEVARAIAFLASDESGMMTGAVVDFDQSVLGAGPASKPPPLDDPYWYTGAASNDEPCVT